MHYDCRQSYCETLRRENRVTREQVCPQDDVFATNGAPCLTRPRRQALDTDQGEFICPMCRQMANALLPVPPEPPANVPAAVFPRDRAERLAVTAEQINRILLEDSVHLVSMSPLLH